ncbi:hypothetical protein A2U01_0104790, partial [Trifolium medium]|nr:hypothetical protein [Trifolium medium]
MKKLVEKGALLTEKDSEGYTPFTLAVELDYGREVVEWMLIEGGNGLLTMKINSDDDK